ncbi:MAG: response regulator, partial [Bacteroidales bacterium]
MVLSSESKNKYSILYVDDSDANLYLFQENFKEDFNVIIAKSGKAGIEIVKKEPLDIIISDQAMPGMTGVEFFEEVLKINPAPNRILLTAYSDIKALADAVNKAKIYQYVNKPWDYEKLKTIIDHAIHEYKLRKENKELTNTLKKQTVELQKLLQSKTELLDKIEESNKALEKSEERLKRIIDLSPIPIVVKDLDDNTVIINDQFKRVFGYTIEDIPNIEAWYKLAYPDPAYREKHRKEWDSRIVNVVENKTVMEPIETIVRCKDGTDKVVQLQSSSVGDNIIAILNDLTKIRSLEKDISYRIKMEEELRKAKQRADAASKSKSEFIASMSHEIRTPMNSILGFADVLEQELTDPVLVDYAKTIHTSGKTLLSLINDILDFSKIEAGKIELKFEAVSIRSLIHDITEIFRFSTQEKNLDIYAEIQDDLPDYLMLDELRIKQMLINLVSNAIKFTEKGYVKIKAHANILSENIAELIISVEDTGIGIAPEQQEKVFKVFEQMEGQDNKKYGGTGLGLAITSKLAAAMNGKIQLDSKVGKGSKFTILLNEVKVTEETEERESIVFSRKEVIHFKKSKVLIVDDIESNRQIIKLKLKKYNFDIYEAKSGKDALDVLNKVTPDLIFIDLHMPDMDGYQFHKKLTEKPQWEKIPTIAITAYTLDNDEV